MIKYLNSSVPNSSNFWKIWYLVDRILCMVIRNEKNWYLVNRILYLVIRIYFASYCLLSWTQKVGHDSRYSWAKFLDSQGWNHPWTRGGQWPPLDFFKKILLYICVLILAIFFYKITFCFSLTIPLILLRVMLYLQKNL